MQQVTLASLLAKIEQFKSNSAAQFSILRKTNKILQICNTKGPILAPDIHSKNRLLDQVRMH